MPVPILTTKLYLPPHRSGLVSRPHLVAHLNQGLAMGRKLTLISASAGFGKTTLLSEWISALPHSLGEGSEVRVSWLSLDEADSDLPRFLAYLVASLQTVTPDIGEEILAALQTSQPPPVEVLLTGLLNEVSALSGNFILVLDDYHLLDSPAVDTALTFLLDHLPPQLHLVLASREDPNLPLPRLRARGQLTELRTADLRFTLAETADFLKRVMGLILSENDVSTLETRTEGWIAGLQLAALSMQGQKDTAAFIHSFTGSHYFVLDYLVEEVLQRQPDKIQAFLLQTSILRNLTGQLCDFTVDLPPGVGQTILEQLERANLFLVPLDSERRWYRYHHLFADLLRQRLGNPPELPAFHLRASQWYESHDQLDEAFHHALSARDFERAAGLAEAVWKDKEGSFQFAAWLSWVNLLPDGGVRARPELCYQLGRAFSDLGEPATSEFHLQNAERAMAGAPNQAGFTHLPGDIALTRAYNAQVQGKLAETIDSAEQALQLIPAEDVFRRAQAAIMLEFTHWASGDLEAALTALHIWMADMRKLGNLVYEIASAFAVADLLLGLGRLDEAEQALHPAIQKAAGQGPEIEAITAHHHLGLAMLAYERGRDEEATVHWQIAAELGQRTTLVDWPYRLKLGQARIKESARDWGAALALLEEAQRVYVKNPVPIARPVDALKARIYLKQGQLDKAETWAKERAISLSDEAGYLSEYELLTLARLRLHDPGVNDLLERLFFLAESQNRLGSVLEILLTQTLVYEAQGDRSHALAALERALILAAPQGYQQTFLDEGDIMRLLLDNFRVRMANTTHPLFGYVKKLVGSFPPAVEVIRQTNIGNQNYAIFEPLTRRELEVLSLIAEGLSNTEISQRLCLALSTVKGHNQRIFDKLQAQNRTEAVVRARDLGLI